MSLRNERCGEEGGGGGEGKIENSGEESSGEKVARPIDLLKLPLHTVGATLL